MSVRFAIFSSDIAATLDPWNADPQPATCIDLGEDPISGDYDPNAGSRGRGSRIQTLGGVVDQDFGVSEKDGKIRLSVHDSAIAASVMEALNAASSVVEGQFFFTDSVNCWKVKFARPDGFKLWRNLYWKSAENADVFSYELLLNVDSKDI